MAREVVIDRIPIGREHWWVRTDEVVERRPAAGPADEEHGRHGGHRNPQPGLRGTQLPPGLVDMGGCGSGLSQRLLVDPGEGVRRLGLESTDGGRADRQAEQVGEGLGHDPLTESAGPAQVRGHRPDPWPVSAGCPDGERGRGSLPTCGTVEAMPAVLGHVWPNCENLVDLVGERVGVVPGPGVVAPSAAIGLEGDNVVRRENGAFVFGVSGLATVAFAGRCPRRTAFDVGRVRGGWGRGVRGGPVEPTSKEPSIDYSVFFPPVRGRMV